MISKQLSVVLSPNGQFVLRKLNLISKNLLNTNSHVNLYHSKAIRCLYSDKSRINNIILRESHTKAEIQAPLNTTGFAHRFMESSEAYSNTLSSTLKVNEDLQIEEIESILQKQWISMSIPEILENFECLSINARKNEESINHPKYHGILEVLKNKLPDFIDQQIHHFFRCLELWKYDGTEEVYKSLLTTLDNECLKRMPGWSTEEILLTNDHFYKLRMARYLEFTWHSLRKLGSKPRKMTPTHLVQYAFFMKMNRRLPIRPYEIEYRVEQHFDNFTIEELAIIALAFSKYEAPIRSNQLMVKIIKTLVSEIDNVNDYCLKALVDILRIGGEPEIVNQLEILLKKMENNISRLDVKTLTAVMNLQRKVLMHNEQLTSKILERCEKEIKDMKLAHLEKILFALHMFNYDPKTTPFYSMAHNELLDPDRAAEIERSPSSLIHITMFLLKQQVYPEEILKRILDPDFVNRTSNSNVYKLDRNYLDIDFYLEFEHPEYNGPRLRKDLVNHLMKFYGSLKKRSVKKSDSDKTIIEIAHIIKKIAKSETAVYVDSIMPHIAKTHIIVCLDPETKEFLSPSEKLSNIPAGRIKYAPDDDKKWYVLSIGSKNLITRDESHKITGLLANEIRQLECIGYTPIVIPQYEWNNMFEEGLKQKYLKNLLFR
ncbi:FAST kinase domains 5-like [Nasonia vitripennis]|uniref:RAP domain-containing protein n=1 Tax=Nasonia vitripennis TaxID=7425 RepID=A0A7M6UUU4_NASVI|nr:FAST kinase domains 5-like [Nasonia vitripennis]